MIENELMVIKDIQSKIFTIRGLQVMLDTDLAICYGVEVRRLNEQVKRNKDRFPESFCFQVKDHEIEILKSQIAISNNTSNLKSQFATSSWGGRRTNPYVFSEQGVAMLSAVLKTKIAVEMSVRIMNAFIEMRKFINTNAQIFQRLDSLEIRQLQTENRMERVLVAIESREVLPKQGIFYDGQIFDAYIFISDLFKTANRSITIIDNYLDDSVLTLLTKRKKGVKVLLFTKKPTKAMIQDVKKCNEQYPPLEIRRFNNSHDRFIIIDEKDLYHFGASLKDLGKKWFAFSKMDIGAVTMLSKLEEL
jgi:hypothetical protein